MMTMMMMQEFKYGFSHTALLEHHTAYLEKK